VSSAQRDAAAGSDLALFHRSLAELCRSELPLPRALRLLEADLDSSPMKAAVRDIADDVESGVPLAEAYATHAAHFPPLYRSLVEVGAAGNDLPGVLEEIAAHAAQRGEVAAKLRRALAYPMIAAGFLAVVGTALLVFVAPTFVELSETVAGNDASSSLFNPVRAPGSASHFMGGWVSLAVAMTIVVVLAVVVGAFMWLRNPMDGAKSGAAARYRFPILGRLRYDADVASLAGTLALLVRRRMPLPRALDLAAEVTEAGPLRKTALAAADAAHGGSGLAESARSAGLFAPSLLWIVEAAEKRGDAAGALDDVARIYRNRLARATDRASVVITPVAELLIGMAVFLLAYAFLAPLMDMTRRIFTLR
jgi:type II secretory pathway component PulF